jgi:hypothetical protein
MDFVKVLIPPAVGGDHRPWVAGTSPLEEVDLVRPPKGQSKAQSGKDMEWHYIAAMGIGANGFAPTVF